MSAPSLAPLIGQERYCATCDRYRLVKDGADTCPLCGQYTRLVTTYRANGTNLVARTPKSDEEAARQYLFQDRNASKRNFDDPLARGSLMTLLSIAAIRLIITDEDFRLYKTFVMSTKSVSDTARWLKIPEATVQSSVKHIEQRIWLAFNSLTGYGNPNTRLMKVQRKDVLAFLDTPAGQDVLTATDKQLYVDAVHRNATREQLAARIGKSSDLKTYLQNIEATILSAMHAGAPDSVVITNDDPADVGEDAEIKRDIIASGGESIGGGIYGSFATGGSKYLYRALKNFKTPAVTFSPSSASDSEGADRHGAIEDDYGDESAA